MKLNKCLDRKHLYVASVLENLKLLNSKERFFLIAFALDNPNFTLSEQFLKTISDNIGIHIPSEAFAAMDYHLDWLFGSVLLSTEPTKHIFDNRELHLTATQQDIDFLIAFEKNGKTHLILLEAKGVTGWSNSQMNAKATRLKKFFGADGKKWDNVIPYFAIVSPKESQGLDSSTWPLWMKPQEKVTWIKLPCTEGLLRIERCDDCGDKSKFGTFWSLRPR